MHCSRSLAVEPLSGPDSAPVSWRLQQGCGPLTAVAWSASGQHLAAACSSGLIQVPAHFSALSCNGFHMSRDLHFLGSEVRISEFLGLQS